MLLETELLEQTNKQTNNKNKTKQNPKNIKIKIKNKSTTKDVICCSNGYIYHFLDYITLLLFVNANVIHHV